MSAAHDWSYETDGPVVRPYAMVRGRTRNEGYRFDLVAFVVAAVDSLDLRLGIQPEHRAILRICQVPCPVGEVASRMNLPVGVVRVLLGDLHTAQAIHVREPTSRTGRPSIRVIREVLDGLREL